MPAPLRELGINIQYTYLSRPTTKDRPSFRSTFLRSQRNVCVPTYTRYYLNSAHPPHNWQPAPYFGCNKSRHPKGKLHNTYHRPESLHNWKIRACRIGFHMRLVFTLQYHTWTLLSSKSMSMFSNDLISKFGEALIKAFRIRTSISIT